MSDPPPEEQHLWRAVLDQDGAAFGRLFDLHKDAVFRQALRLVAQPADAEEVAAAAFFELWRKRGGVQLVGGSVRPWLLVTVANLSRNSRRARMRREALLRRLPPPREDPTDRGFDRIDDDLPRSALVAAIRLLPPRDRALLTLTALDGYPLAEVADLLGLTENAARVRLHRARQKLRGALDPGGHGRLDLDGVPR